MCPSQATFSIHSRASSVYDMPNRATTTVDPGSVITHQPVHHPRLTERAPRPGPVERKPCLHRTRHAASLLHSVASGALRPQGVCSLHRSGGVTQRRRHGREGGTEGGRDGQRDGRDGQREGRTEGGTDRGRDGRREGRTEGGTDRGRDGRREGRTEGREGRTEGGTDGGTEGRREGRRDGGTEGRRDGGTEGGTEGGRPARGDPKPCLLADEPVCCHVVRPPGATLDRDRRCVTPADTFLRRKTGTSSRLARRPSRRARGAAGGTRRRVGQRGGCGGHQVGARAGWQPSGWARGPAGSQAGGRAAAQDSQDSQDSQGTR